MAPVEVSSSDRELASEYRELCHIDADRYWARVDRSGGPDGCWPWIGGRSGHPRHARERHYGRLRVAGKITGAHVVAYTLTHGALPIGGETCHSCDNPPCCNPAHLFAGTHRENLQDAARKGRTHSFPRGRRHPLAKLTPPAVMAIRARAASGESQRALAREYGVSQVAVCFVVARKTWAHIPDVRRCADGVVAAGHGPAA